MLVFSCAIVAAVVGFNVRVNLASQVFAFLLAVILISIIFSCYFRGKFRLRRSLPDFATVGDKFEYSIQIDNNSSVVQEGLFVFDQLQDSFPEYDDFKDLPNPLGVTKNFFDKYVGYPRWLWYVNRLRGADSELVVVPKISPKATSNIYLSLTPSRRGYIKFCSFVLSRDDPFGLMKATKKINCYDSLLVLPKRYKVPHIDLGGGSQYQQGGVVLASSLGESEEFVSLREYRPGDSFRGIHWKSWAKIGKPVIKETQPEYLTRNALVLDTIVTGDKDPQFEEAVSVAASFLCSMDLHETLLDLIFVGDRPYKYTAGRGVGTHNSLVKVLSCAQRSARADFNSLEASVMQNIGQVSGCILVFVGFDEQRQKLVNRLVVSGVKARVFVICEVDEVAGLRGEHSSGGITFLPMGQIEQELSGVRI